MPFMKNGKRDYEREYQWIKKTGGIKKIAARVQARRDVIKKVGKAAVAGKDVDHKTSLSKGGGNSMSNLRVVSASSNRSFSRNADGSMKSQTSKKERKRK
jgi:5-methylcytosine-specific restriction endonuclease McrA